MFSNRLRSWMEAVRPKKKQQRKEKQQKAMAAELAKNPQVLTSPRPVQNDGDVNGELKHNPGDRTQADVHNTSTSRYSGANLSSPESAYSTGYSTDGTSPGAPPEYYINIRTGSCVPSACADPKRPGLGARNASSCCKENSHHFLTSSHAKTSSRPNLSPPRRERERLPTVAVRYDGDRTTVSMVQDYEAGRTTTSHTSVTLSNLNPPSGVPQRLTEVVVNSSVTSPRQRNRIRTNPWVPGNNLSPGSSSTGLHMRQDHLSNPNAISSPVSLRYLSPNTAACSPSKKPNRCNSLSSSSCSSLSAASVQWDSTIVRRSPRNNSISDEDCTLNEMMGKYDESYVYEKETDILSDSDPTDCETDIDTGQDGGDEEDPLESEFDFIDNGSYLEFSVDGKEGKNLGHCTYYNFEIQRKTSRRRTARKSHKQECGTERKKRSNSSKKRTKQQEPPVRAGVNGSRSAGATPLSVRRTNLPVSKLALEDRLRKRSNSVSFSRSPISTFDKRDKEAEKKYKELIVEAEHILLSMKSNGLSPRRIPGPPNKRVELLRSTECSKPEAFIKPRLADDIPGSVHLSKIPSNNYGSPRFSPKRNHITNFINHNSPVLMRRDATASPLAIRKDAELKSSSVSPQMTRNKHLQRRSPKHKKKLRPKHEGESLSSDSETDSKSSRLFGKNKDSEFCCPQSEPVKRKVYNKKHKAVAFNLNSQGLCEKEVPITASSKFLHCERSSTENLRQQVLLNTIANLKRSLEDQSASLKQVYKGSQILDG